MTNVTKIFIVLFSLVTIGCSSELQSENKKKSKELTQDIDVIF